MNNNTKYFLNLKLYPNRSLSLLSFMIFSLILILTTVIASMYFIGIGAWPVSFFLLLDLGLIFFAFKKYDKESKTYDRIILKKKLFVISVNKNGKRITKIIEPTWLRLKVYSGRKSRYLSIMSKGRSVKVGRFLNIKELSDLATLIKKALIKREQELTFNS